MSAAVTTGLFTLGGVLAGGTINVLVAEVQDRRARNAATRNAARLVALEISTNRNVLTACLETGMWTAMRNYPLRFERWETYAAVLATIKHADWSSLTTSFRRVEQLHRLHGPPFEHTQLSPMDPRHVELAVDASDTALAVLERLSR